MQSFLATSISEFYLLSKGTFDGSSEKSSFPRFFVVSDISLLLLKNKYNKVLLIQLKVNCSFVLITVFVCFFK